MKNVNFFTQPGFERLSESHVTFFLELLSISADLIGELFKFFLYLLYLVWLKRFIIGELDLPIMFMSFC